MRPAVAGLLCAALVGVASAAAALPVSGFVRVEGTRFVVGGKPLYFVGANLHVMHGPRARRLAERTIAAAAKDGLRVGRVWALGEGTAEASDWDKAHTLFRAGPKGWQASAFEQLDRVIAAAGRHGMRLVITISNRWKDYGGLPMYLRWAGDRDRQVYGYRDRFFTRPDIRRYFLDHLRRVVGRVNKLTGRAYKDDPTIMAWELQNEMVGTPEAAAARRSWVVAMAREVRRLDPNHLVVSGALGYFLQRERADWLKMCRLPAVSYCDQHVYPEEHALARGRRNLHAFIDDRVQLAHYVVGKPIVFGEFGFADRGRATRRKARHVRFLKRLFYDGGNGALVWIYQPTLDWRRRYGVLIDKRRYRSLRRALGREARRVSRRIPRARNRRLGKAQGEKPLAPSHVLEREYRRLHRHWRHPRALQRPPSEVARPAPASLPSPRCRELHIPVDRYAATFFEESGSWDGGVLVHAYGRRTGWLRYRFEGPRFRVDSLRLRVRLSSEYPGAVAPPHGSSDVAIRLDGMLLAKLRVPPDDGRGRVYELVLRDKRLLGRMAHRAHRLTFSVEAGPFANGVAIYGREAPLNRQPIADAGPLTLLACPRHR